MKDNVLVVAPHPDDETLGCGGTLLKHKNSGDNIYWMIVTNIQIGNGWHEEVVQKRQKEIHQVADMYSFEKVFKLEFPTTKLDTIPYSEIISKMSIVIQEVKPSIVYVPNCNDIHTDHQITFKAVMSSCKHFRAPYIRKILMYECLSETEFAPAVSLYAFVPNCFVNISEYFLHELEIFRVYESEIMKPSFPRSIETITSLARYRGSCIGKEYAKAFCLLFQKIT